MQRISLEQYSKCDGTGRAGRRTGAAARGQASTENGQRSRDRVLKAALELITEAGIDRVRVAGIARRASMSSGQVMYYFTSKEHILLETLAWQGPLTSWGPQPPWRR